MSDQLFWLCEHGEAKAHGVQPKFPSPTLPFVACPGGHLIEGGEAVRYCTKHQSIAELGVTYCHASRPWNYEHPCVFVERFLIPLPGVSN